MDGYSYDDAVEEIARRYGVPKSVYQRMVGQESGGRDSAVSNKGASSRWQIMPATAKGLGIDASDPLQAAEGGLRILRDNYKRFRKYAENEKHAWMMSVAGYHGSPSNVEKDIKNGGYGLPMISDGAITTRDHVLKIFDGIRAETLDRNPFGKVRPQVRQPQMNAQNTQLQPQQPDILGNLTNQKADLERQFQLATSPRQKRIIKRSIDLLNNSINEEAQKLSKLTVPEADGNPQVQKQQFNKKGDALITENQSPQLNTTAPVPETAVTLNAQKESTKRDDSPRIATLYTKDAPIEPLTPEEKKTLFDVFIEDTGEVVRLNREKANQFFGREATPLLVKGFIRSNGYADLIAKAENVGTATSDGIGISARDKDGNELSWSKVTTPESAEKQIEINQKEFGKDVTQTPETVEQVTSQRTFIEDSNKNSYFQVPDQQNLKKGEARYFHNGKNYILDEKGQIRDENPPKQPLVLKTQDGRTLIESGDQSGLEPHQIRVRDNSNDKGGIQIVTDLGDGKYSIVNATAKKLTAPQWVNGSSKPVTELPPDKLLRQTYEENRKYFGLADTEELRQKYIKGYQAIRNGQAQSILTDEEYQYLELRKANAGNKVDGQPPIEQPKQGGVLQQINPTTKIQKLVSADGFTAKVDPDEVIEGKGKNESAFRQAAKQLGNKIYNRPLDSLEVEALAQKQKAEKGGFVFDTETDKPIEASKGDFKFTGADVESNRIYLDKIQPELQKQRQYALANFIESTLELSPMERQKFNDMGLSDEVIDQAFTTDPRFQEARNQREANKVFYEERFNQYQQNDSPRLAQVKALRDIGVVKQDRVDDEIKNESEARQRLEENLKNPSWYQNAWNSSREALTSVIDYVNPVNAIDDWWQNLPHEFKTVSDPEIKKRQQKALLDNIRGIEKEFGSIQEYEKFLEANQGEEKNPVRQVKQFGRNAIKLLAEIPKTLDNFDAVNEQISPLGLFIPRDYLPSLRNAGNVLVSVGNFLSGENVPLVPRDAPLEERQLYALGKDIQQMIGDDPYLRRTFSGELNSALASGVTFLLGGAVLKGTKYGAGILGVLTQVGSTYDELRQKGVSPEEAKYYSIGIGLPLGYSEQWGLGGTAHRALAKLGSELSDDAVKSLVKSMMTFAKETASAVKHEFTEEFLQEWGQSSVGAAAINAIAAKDKSAGAKIKFFLQELPRQAVENIPQGLLGGLSGGILGGTVNAAVIGTNTIANSAKKSEGIEPEILNEAQAAVLSETPKEAEFRDNKVEAELAKPKKELTIGEAEILPTQAKIEVPKEVTPTAEKPSKLTVPAINNESFEKYRQAVFPENTDSAEAVRDAMLENTKKLISDKFDAEAEALTATTEKERAEAQERAEQIAGEFDDRIKEVEKAFGKPMADYVKSFDYEKTQTEIQPQPPSLGAKPLVSDSSLQTNDAQISEVIPPQNAQDNSDKSPKPITKGDTVKFAGKTAQVESVSDDGNKVTLEGSEKPIPIAKVKKVAKEFQSVQKLGQELFPKKAEKVEAKPPREFSSTQVDIDLNTTKEIQKFSQGFIDEKDLAEDGREEKSHATAKFGLETDNAEDVRPLVEDMKPFTAKLGKTFIFDTNPDFDVVNFEINSPELVELNKRIAKLPNQDSHPKYTPHVAIAYVKKGMGQKYVGNTEFEGKEIKFDGLTFSDKNRNKIFIPFKGKAESITQPSNKEVKQTQVVTNNQTEKTESPSNKPIENQEYSLNFLDDNKSITKKRLEAPITKEITNSRGDVMQTETTLKKEQKAIGKKLEILRALANCING
jgi:2'-5' RNA ligase